MKKIMVAKKNDLLRQTMVWALNQFNYERIVQAHCVAGLIEKAEASDFDLIILDLGICKELGIKQLRKIKKKNTSIRFIIIKPNGAIEEKYKKNLMAAGVKTFIPNDPSTKILFSAVTKVLSGQKIRNHNRKNKPKQN